MLVGLAGCNALTDRQRMLLVEGEQAYRNKQYDLAAERLSTFLDEVRDRPETGRALYVRGMARALAGQRAWAYADLQRAASQPGQGQIAWQANAVLGVLYFEDENWEAALRALQTAVDGMPSMAPKDALLFRMGLCYERSGRWSAALTPYRRIVSEFPSGRYAEAAQRRLQLRADHFAIQCGVFSRTENAEQLVRKLKREGLQTYVRQEPRKETTCYVVLEGRYGSYQQANQALAKVRGYVPDAVLWP